ncbi:MAG: hypothetical protein GZ092_17250 [Polaromonas sp.]|nr:hypothetical protein [Polaromonas sp.]
MFVLTAQTSVGTTVALALQGLARQDHVKPVVHVLKTGFTHTRYAQAAIYFAADD